VRATDGSYYRIGKRHFRAKPARANPLEKLELMTYLPHQNREGKFEPPGITLHLETDREDRHIQLVLSPLGLESLTAQMLEQVPMGLVLQGDDPACRLEKAIAAPGGYVTQHNPPRTGDVLIFKNRSWRVDQVVGGEGGFISLDEGRHGLADYRNVTLDELIESKAYYSHRSVAVAPPEGVSRWKELADESA
jgi:hypothetical protein